MVSVVIGCGSGGAFVPEMEVEVGRSMQKFRDGEVHIHVYIPPTDPFSTTGITLAPFQQ